MAQILDAGLLECDFCKKVFSLREEKFPRDLYSLMVKYNVSQLIWICSPCKEVKERNFSYFLSLAERQREMEKTLNSLAVAVNQLHSAIQPNGSDSNVVDGSQSDSAFEKIVHSFSSPLPRNERSYVYESETSSSDEVSLSSFSTVSFGSSSSTINAITPVLSDVARFLSDFSPASCSNYNGKKALGVLKKILSEKVKIDDDETKRNKLILTEFLDKLLVALKGGSAEFKQLYQRLYYTGSSYEELRIGKADEFDINLVLKFPFQKQCLQVEFAEEYPSYARCVCVGELYDGHPQLLKLFFENGCLMPAKVRRWMQSLISKFITVPGFEKPANVKKIEPSQSGPAYTLKLHTVDGCRIDIDLVPVLQFADPEWPPLCDRSSLGNFELSQEEKFWFLVPKPFLSADGSTSLECQTLWRIHFPDVEKRFIHGRGCVKPVIKLLKLLRDKEESWKIISSYYLKTVLMWEIQAHPDVMYWNENLMGERFLQVLKKLDGYVMLRKLPHFLFPGVNLFERMKPGRSDNIHGRLQNIMKEISKDTSNLYPVFGLASCPQL